MGEAVDTFITLGRWGLAWIVVLALAGTITLLAAALTGAWAWRAAWEGVAGAVRAWKALRALPAVQATLTASQAHSEPFTYRETA